MQTNKLSRVDIVRIVKEECGDTIFYADILNSDRDRRLVQMVVRGLWRSIEQRLGRDLRGRVEDAAHV